MICMKLIVGLGNPEFRYDGTRHNVGFAMLDIYAKREKAKWQDKPKFKALIAELMADEKIILAKPTTYYNLSGETVRAIADFYKIPVENILVVHDDYALPFGTLRTREQGSDGGNNGIKSINTHMGPGTNRVRIGTGTDLRDQMSDSDYVLSKFSEAERKDLIAMQHKIAEIIDNFINNKFFATTHK
ncbi:aminoacyl-tRNA hydrolase [Candidatus Saccharibacteria bacterium]|nr:aminoacyl-tRNA hydrolase [Candidatus Saccharibacteria bacterium]